MIADYKCPECGSEKIDHYVKSRKEEVKCECGAKMNKKFSSPAARTACRKL